MNTIDLLFQQAQFAEAAYADLTGIAGLVDTQPFMDRLKAAGMSDAQATAFVAQWKVVDQQPDTSNGFSATVFQDKVTGEYSFALRGTADATDLMADAGDVLIDGVALDQIVDMYNYWESLTHTGSYQAAQLNTLTVETVALQAAYLISTAAGLVYESILRARPDIIIDNPTHTVRTVQYVDSSQLSDPRLQTGSGILAGATAVNVDGHSLGGHLAMAFSRLFPNAANSIVAVNGPGFNFGNSNVDHLFTMLSGAPAFDAAKITNVVGSAAMNLVSQDWLFLQQPAGRIEIYTESASPANRFGHGSGQMTASLAIYDLFAKIDPTLNTTDPAVGIIKITDGLKAASNKPVLSLEASLDALRQLFKDPAVQSVAPTATDNREQFYQNLYDTGFQQRITSYAGQLSFVSQVGRDAFSIEANSYSDVGYRYSLRELIPFAIVGQASLYDTHNPQHELDIFNSVAKPDGRLTNEYVADRAKMLYWVIQRNIDDREGVLPNPAGENMQFTDRRVVNQLQSDGTLKDVLVTDTIRVGASIKQPMLTAFGSDQPDSFVGSGHADRLYGGGGKDLLVGNGGDDYMEGGFGDDDLDGGVGNDTYVYLGKEGNDTVVDSDGLGKILYAGRDLTGVKTQINATGDLFSDSTFTYKYYVHGQSAILTITKDGDPTGKVTVQNFKSGDLGITLDRVASTQTYTDKLGTADADNLVSDAPYQKVFGLGGNDLIQLATIGAQGYGGDGDDVITNDDGAQQLYGEAGNDVLIASGGNDELYGGLDRDALQGGADDDYLEGNEGDDFLAGGDGEDVLVGADGDDSLFGDAPIVALDSGWAVTYTDNGTSVTAAPNNHFSGTLDNPNGQADLLIGGIGNDHLFGGAGDDYLQGDEGIDFLSGDEGDDYLDGGADDDKLVGGAGSDALFGSDGNDQLFGDVNDIDGALQGDDYLDGGLGNDIITGDGGSDTLFGGDGDDQLFGDSSDTPLAFQGDDYLDGGAGTDTLNGLGGSDTLFGGEGDDTLFGDSSTTPLAYQGDDYLDGEAGNDFLEGFGGDDMLFGGDGNDLIFADAGNDYVEGGIGDDQISGGDGDDQILGGAGNDTILGDAGDDTIDGEDGNDLIAAGTGNDNVFGGAGFDQLQGGGGNDTLDGGTEDDVLFGDAGDDNLTGGAGNDQLVGGGGTDTLFGGDGDDFLFGDGDDIATADQAADVISGGLGNDNIRGYGGDDQLFGDDGSDTIFGEAGADYIEGGSGDDFLYGDSDLTPLADQGNDTLDGGAGVDQLVGYAGNDTYVFGRGYGQDLIFDQDTTAGNIDRVQFAADITPDDITATRGPVFINDLVLTINGTTDAITIANQLSTNTANRVEEIRFADGTVWTPTTTPMLIQGTTANNLINGTLGPDVIEGLAGNDTLQGGTGGDRYRFYRGDGADLITDSDATVGNVDKVLYAADILPSDIQASRLGSNLVLRLTGTTDQVTISNYFQNDGTTPFSVEQIKFFVDGTIWDVNTVKQMVLTGTSGADTITGYATDDTLTGLSGNDTLTGNAGNDTLNGGTGNDVLQGSTGNDTYLITRGDGQDTITDVDTTVGNVDRIVYANDILPSEVKATRSSNNLVLSLTGTADQVTVTNYFENDGATPSSVEQVQFLADGTIWDVNTVKTLVLTGTAGSDTITGYATDDVLSGLGGNDTLIGNAGNDTLDGGPGNDNLQGGTGNDTYRIFRGDGQDTITDSDATVGNVDTLVYAADILPLQVQATRSGNNLVLTLTGTADQATISNYFLNDGATPFSVEQIKFSVDSTIWDVNTVKSMPITPTSGNDTIIGYSTNDSLSGLGGNDVIRGGGGNDTLDGGTGNDGLFGEDGSDTYLFAIGSGQDTITNADSDTGGTTDVLQFTAGIAPSQITTTKSVNDLVLTINGTADQAVIRDYFLGGNAIVEQIKFADGTIWTEQTIASFFPISGTSGNDNLQGTGLSETINGLAGNDTLRGGAGNDTIDGGLGSDQIFGEDGNDILIAGDGDSKNAKVSNSLHGGPGDDVLIASGNFLDHLYGEAGNDILLGGSNRDSLEDTAGNNLMVGNATSDFIDMGDQNDLVIGGAGDDFIDGDNSNINGIRGRDILVFNKSDGQDSVSRLGSGSTISIGGGALYSNLSLVAVSNSALELKVGNNYIFLNNWYDAPGEKTVSTLQIVIEGTRDYSATSTNPINNKKIQEFDFLGLVSAFDVARAAGKTFNVANNLPTYRLSGSDTAAIGGAIAYTYAKSSSISTLTDAQMQAFLAAPEFGVSAQSISTTAAATALATDTSVTTTAAVESFSAQTSTLLTTDVSAAGADSVEVSNPAQPETPTAGASPDSDGLPERADNRVAQHELPTMASPISAPLPSPAQIVAAVPRSGAAPQLSMAAGSVSTTPPSNGTATHAAASESFPSEPPSALPTPGRGTESADAARASNASATAGKPPNGDRLSEPMAALVADWFAQQPPSQDLSQLDDIARGEGVISASTSGESVAAAWQRSQHWVNRLLDARNSGGSDDADGAYLGNLPFLGASSALSELPQAAVGLRHVAGHDLKPFSGLREGVSVLTQP